MLDFKDFITVEYMPGYDQLINYRATRRKRGVVGEELSIGARRKASIRMKRLSKKIARLRKRKLNRVADGETINRRSQKQARDELFRKFSGGKSRSELPVSQRKNIEKKVARMASLVKNKGVRKRSATRKLDRSRKGSS